MPFENSRLSLVGFKRFFLVTRQAVKSTRLHEDEDPNTVYALAVYIEPYVNKLASIWVYVLAMKL